MRRSVTIIVAAGLLLSLLLGGIVSYFASGSPDGLNRVAEDEGLAQTEEQHGLDDSPLAGYETRGVNGAPSGGLAGLAGVGLTFLVASGVVLVVRRRHAARAEHPEPEPSGR